MWIGRRGWGGATRLRPSFELLKRRLADRLGGGPKQHRRLALAVAALCHGTATLLLAEGIQVRVSMELRNTCVAAVETLASCSRRIPKAKNARRFC